jgi:hypothetical protein
MSLADQRKAAEKEGLLGNSDYLKIKEGKNQIRVVSDALPHPGEFKGKRTFKWLVYVIDRADGNVKPYFMPNKVFAALEDLQTDEDHGFEGMPMPYDVSVNAKNAGTIDVEYSVVPRKPSALTADERNKVDAAKPLKELQQALRAKNEQPAQKPADGHFDPDEIPT